MGSVTISTFAKGAPVRSPAYFPSVPPVPSRLALALVSPAPVPVSPSALFPHHGRGRSSQEFSRTLAYHAEMPETPAID